MRIEKAGNRPGSLSSERAKGLEGPLHGAASKNFDDFLQDSRYRTLEEELSHLMADIKEQGERLAKRLNLQELLRYKKLVAQFLNKVVNEMFQLKKNSSWDYRGRHNIYALVKKVNDRLEELTEEIINSQKDQLFVLSCVDDIRGLLLDLFM